MADALSWSSLLAVDTSTNTQSLALRTPDGELLTRSYVNQRGRGASLQQALAELLQRAGLGTGDIDLMVVGSGPGSFTGLRISLACLKGLAFVHQTPLAALSSLQALAWGARGRSGLVVPMLDARKKEVYTGLYRIQGDALPQEALADRCVPPSALPALLRQHQRDPQEPLYLLGEGAQAYRQALEEALEGLPVHWLDEAPQTPQAEALAALAQGLTAQDIPPLFTLEPNYQRLSEAEVKFGPAPVLPR